MNTIFFDVDAKCWGCCHCEHLVSQVWGYEEGTETNVVDVYIRYLRNKIDVEGQDSYIQTVRGLGYVMRERK